MIIIRGTSKLLYYTGKFTDQVGIVLLFRQFKENTYLRMQAAVQQDLLLHTKQAGEAK